MSPITIEVLHVRDPDARCETAVFINGRQTVFGVTEHNIDPGAGHDLESWDATTSDVEADPTLTTAFRDAIVEIRNAYRDHQYIESKE